MIKFNFKYSNCPKPPKTAALKASKLLMIKIWVFFNFSINQKNSHISIKNAHIWRKKMFYRLSSHCGSIFTNYLNRTSRITLLFYFMHKKSYISEIVAMAPSSSSTLEDLGILPGHGFPERVRKVVDLGKLNFYSFSLKNILQLRYQIILLANRSWAG